MEFIIYKRIDREKRDVYFFNFFIDDYYYGIVKIPKSIINNFGFLIYRTDGNFIILKVFSLTKNTLDNNYNKIDLNDFNLSFKDVIKSLEINKYKLDKDIRPKWHTIKNKFKDYNIDSYINLLFNSFNKLLITEKIKKFINNESLY